MNRQTPLYGAQKRLGARFIAFGGWELPVSYGDILKEHQAVRNGAGLFDVSHMGELMVTGEEALSFVNGLITNDLSPVPDNKALYSPMCYDNGTVVDDIILYKLRPDKILLVVNAGNTEKDEAWIRSRLKGKVSLENVSHGFVQLALQGPRAYHILKRLLPQDAVFPRFFCYTWLELLGMKVLLSRSGYTGEDGFEIYLDLSQPGADPEKLWEGLLSSGEEEGLVPVGLGARDTLRLEAALPLYGHELSEAITPLEAGLARFIKLQKGEFIGKEALEEQNRKGVDKMLFGFLMEDRAIPRNGYQVLHRGEKVGYVTSGGPLPSLNRNGGLFLSHVPDLSPGDRVEIIVRDRAARAEIVRVPFYEKKYPRY